MKNIIIDGKVKTICEKCGEEIKSINHKCNIFRKRNNNIQTKFQEVKK